MNCTYQESTAYRFAEGNLEQARTEEFANHLHSCARCQARVAEAEHLETLLKATITPIAAPAGLAGRIAQSVAVERESRRWRLGRPLPWPGRRFATALAAVVLALGLVVVAAGPESVMSAVQRALFFIPGIGISDVEADNLVATGPVTAHDGAVTFTVEALLSDRQWTHVEFSVSGLPGGKDGWDKAARVGSEPPASSTKPTRAPSLRDDAGREYAVQTASFGIGGDPSENHVEGTLTFLPLPATVREVVVTVPADYVTPATVLPGADEKEWVVRVPVKAASQSGVPLARPQAVEATANGVSLRLAASAVEDGQTALLVEGDAAGEARVVALGGNGMDSNQLVVLRDSLGRTYKRLEPTSSMVVGENELRQTLYFERPALFAGDLTLAVQTVQVIEAGEAEVTVPLAGRTLGETFALDRVVALGGQQVLLKSARLVDEGYGPWLYVDVDLGDAKDGRLFSAFSVDGAGSWMSSNGAREGTQMSHFGVALEPGQQEATLRLSHPLVNVDGPWELAFPVAGQ